MIHFFLLFDRKISGDYTLFYLRSKHCFAIRWPETQLGKYLYPIRWKPPWKYLLVTLLFFLRTWGYRHHWSWQYAGRVSHMNFIINIAHRRVSGAQWYSIGARNPKVWVPFLLVTQKIFSLSHARDKTKNKTSTSKKKNMFLLLYYSSQRSLILN